MEINEEITKYYTNSRVEFDRLDTGACQLEKARTQEILLKYLPKNRLKILDVGGATGTYALWLSGLGHEVHLVDPVPLHVEEARRRSAQAQNPLATIGYGEARHLAFNDYYFDVVLLFGPLYHLTVKEERIAALLEAKRVIKKDGLVFCAAISRFASMLDGFFRGMVTHPEYVKAMEKDLVNGQHRNSGENPEYFTTSYAHLPAELGNEVAAAELNLDSLVATDSFGWLLSDFDAKWQHAGYRKLLLKSINMVAEDSSLLGMSAHIMAVCRK